MTKTVLITGCSSGIGRATAEAFLEDEWTVYATARDEDDIADLDDAGCETAELDVTNAREVERVVDRIADEQGRIDCLVNNAGTAQFGPLEDVPTDALDDQFDVNVYGPHRLIRAVLPHMRDREEGRIINVSSVTGFLATPGEGAYSASKFALEGLSDALRNEVDQYGIEVVLVEPGPVATEFEQRVEASRDRLERSGAYEAIYGIQDDRAAIEASDTFGMAPEAVATTIKDAATVTDPDPRYPVGRLAKAATLARHLPDRARDRVWGLLRRVTSLRR
ncbi:SDR family oxidoreductase [Halapricum desulfuricans]|uniref:Short-chain alcohol dehydrogenase n=1 Tax=Halapricum desulfuricans TaxID=2841257 RepID=A0A897NQC4_9EURY|nr:SDR family oxidoreductase [Halapricum desulfuricans]QSG14982.1 Short-chain alcohol dehydrogenase [Halapricum desulfuricans]